VGRELVASSEAQIRERLRERGMSEYLLHPLSLEDIRRTVNDAQKFRFAEEYLVCDILGRGSSGVVHKAKRLRDGKLFALKEIPTRQLKRAAKESLDMEVQLLQKLSWPTLASLEDAWELTQQKLRIIVMPLLSGGTLKDWIEAINGGEEGTESVGVRSAVSSSSISSHVDSRPSHAPDWYLQTLHGLTYLHWNGILHRDIKPGNLLLEAGGRLLQIGDFGSALLMPGPGPHPKFGNDVGAGVCTPHYSAPETTMMSRSSASSDMWCVGATFFEVVTLESLIPMDFDFQELDDREVWERLLEDQLEFLQ
ncbi:unnamed protein product, partial [Polarella glacialis]